jgi:hypothetical protein
MRKARILLILGVWITLIPYTGFPYSWKDVLTTLSGFILVYFSYIIYKEYKAKQNTKTFDNFIENSDFGANEKQMDGVAEIEITEERENTELSDEEI